MRKILVFTAALLVALAVVAPVHADPPERTDEPIFGVFPDSEHGFAVFWNITRDDFCTWAAGGFEGPPPVVELVPATNLETGKGAVVASYKATRPIELWSLDSDVPPLTDPCSDTDEQSQAWATGTAHVVYTDNDRFVSLTRMNSFGDRGQGTVQDAGGDAWHYSWAFRAQVDQDGEFSVVHEHFTLKKKGN